MTYILRSKVQLQYPLTAVRLCCCTILGSEAQLTATEHGSASAWVRGKKRYLPLPEHGSAFARAGVKQNT